MSRKRKQRKRARKRAPVSTASSTATTHSKSSGASGSTGSAETGGLEPWARVGYVLLVLGVLLFVVLASRPGGRFAVGLYRFGPTLLGLLVAVNLAFGLIRSLVTRPVLQRGRLGAWLALAAVFWLASFPLAYPSSYEGHPSRVPLVLPVTGDWLVRWGGDRRESNPLVLSPDRRFGIVLEPAREEPGDGSSTGDFVVLAPADGRIERFDPIGPGVGPGDSVAGQTLVLEVGADQFLFLGPLDLGSLRVEAGDRVRAGDELASLLRGQVSGADNQASRPYLALHIQDTAEPGWGEGIPMRFHEILVNGESVKLTSLVKGQKVCAGATERAHEPR